MVKKEEREEIKADWFDELDMELEKKTESIIKDLTEKNSRKISINQMLLNDLWRIWIRFNKIRVYLTMEPSYSTFAQFEHFPTSWKLKRNFDYGALNHLSLLDTSTEEGRMGDGIVVNYYTSKDTLHIRMEFEYCEGEYYYRYMGWKRHYARHVLYDTPIDKIDIKALHDTLGGVVRAWYESHLRRDRDILLNYIKSNYERIESFSK
jgi:hypothetical protein